MHMAVNSVPVSQVITCPPPFSASPFFRYPLFQQNTQKTALLRAGGGSIINTASFVALRGAATPQLAYTSSKGAVLAMTRELAVLHAKEGIRLNSLCPGALRTEMLMAFLDTKEKKQRRLVHVPMGRFGEVKEMANGVVFLVSELIVDGSLCCILYVAP